MFISAVVLILQEILEAALLVSVMLMFTHLCNQLWRGSMRLSRFWVLYSISFGVLGAWIFAYFTPIISTWFDYVGQELFNAGIHITSFVLLMLLVFVVPLSRFDHKPHARSRLIAICMVGVVLFSIVREGSEIYLYLSGVTSQPGDGTAAILGGLLGAGIGVSVGILLFYGLVTPGNKVAFRAAPILLCLIAGNMVSQVALLLNQADWLPYTPALWNSASYISESSIAGRLLYVMIGYEATPSAAQVVCYVTGMFAIIISPLWCRLWWFDPVTSASTMEVAQ